MQIEIRLLLLSLIVAGFCEAGFAQEQHVVAHDKVQEEISALKRDVAALMAEQHQLLDQLDELKQLLPKRRPQPPSTLDIHGQHFRGESGAGIAIIEYADYECPYCGQFAREVYPHIFDNYIKTGKVKYFYHDLPLPGHSHATLAARAATCGGEQGKFWEVHDDMFANQKALELKDISDRAQRLGVDSEKFLECLSSEKYTDDIRKSMSEAESLGIEGTPTFFIGAIGPNSDVVKVSKIVAGSNAYEKFAAALDAALAAKSQESVSDH